MRDESVLKFDRVEPSHPFTSPPKAFASSKYQAFAAPVLFPGPARRWARASSSSGTWARAFRAVCSNGEVEELIAPDAP